MRTLRLGCDLDQVVGVGAVEDELDGVAGAPVDRGVAVAFALRNTRPHWSAQPIARAAAVVR